MCLLKDNTLKVTIKKKNDCVIFVTRITLFIELPSLLSVKVFAHNNAVNNRTVAVKVSHTTCNYM